MKKYEVINSYADALKENNYEAMINLFTEDAKVFSFQAGVQSPKIFFENLFKNSRREEVEVKSIYLNEKDGAAVHLLLNAVLMGENQINIEAVDLFEFDSQNRIKGLKIVLDTHAIMVLKEKIQQEKFSSSQEESYIREKTGISPLNKSALGFTLFGGAVAAIAVGVGYYCGRK